MKRFGADERGVFAVIFGVLAIVLVALGGSAVDFVNVQNARSLAQSSLDAATLALQPDIDSKTEAELKSLANDFVVERLAGTNVTIEVERAEKDTATGKLFMEARLNVPLPFLSIVGVPRMRSRIHSEVTSKSLNIEVALVLDNTASMAGSKLRALRDAANLLVNELMPEEENQDIKIALVPFNRYVNIGMGNRNEPGLDIPADYNWTPSGQRCRNTYPNDTRRCDRRRETYSCVRDGVRRTCSRWVYYNCTGSRGAPVRVCQPQYTRYFRWRGCMASRHVTGLDTRDDSYGTNGVPGVMRHWNTCRITPITELTSTRQDLRDGIRAMRARDNTYIPTGLMWGWRLLSPGIPFTSAEPYSGENKKIIVLMTDGRNTISPSLAWTYRDGNSHRVHRGGNTGVANAKTAEICSNVKDENIIIYTIAFNVSDSTIRTILSDCAGNGGRYFDATDANALREAFAEIADDLQSLRLSR